MLQQEDRVLKNGVSITPKLECAPQARFDFGGGVLSLCLQYIWPTGYQPAKNVPSTREKAREEASQSFRVLLPNCKNIPSPRRRVREGGSQLLHDIENGGGQCLA